MALDEALTRKILDFVKPEPRTMQEIARRIGKSWLTADSYVQQIKEKTGLLNVKTFRKGTQGALKLVYYSSTDALIGDELKEGLYSQIRAAHRKEDFDFMEVFQFVPEKKKRLFIDEYEGKDVSRRLYLTPLVEQAEGNVYIFSGNLSFLQARGGRSSVADVLEGLLKRKVAIRVLCRTNLATLNNISALSRLMVKYPGLIEARHCCQPLRGFIIDGKVARFKHEEKPEDYRAGELERSMKVYYEVYDEEWVAWLQKVFWALYRPSLDLASRLRELKKVHGKAR